MNQTEEQRAKARERSRKWREGHREQHRAYSKAYREANREKCRISDKKKYFQNWERRQELAKQWAKRHPEKVREYSARKTKEQRRRYQRNWYKNNKYKMLVVTRRYQAAKINATPAWADQLKIREFYAVAERLTAQTGTKYHVDHLVPLVSKTVCGLHVEHNLRVIPATENMKKSNRMWPDMP